MHTASVLRRAFKFPNLIAPAIQHRGRRVSKVSHLVCLDTTPLAATVREWLWVLRNTFGSLFLPIGFPPPILEIEELYPLAGRDINVTCSGHVLTSPSPTLRLKGAPDVPAPGETAWLLLTTREEDNGRNFSCEASLEVQGQRLIKTTAVQLHVLCE